jgi:hypothetical protein
MFGSISYSVRLRSKRRYVFILPSAHLSRCFSCQLKVPFRWCLEVYMKFLENLILICKCLLTSELFYKVKWFFYQRSEQTALHKKVGKINKYMKKTTIVTVQSKSWNVFDSSSRGHGFDFHSRHLFSLRCSIHVSDLRRTDCFSKESYRMSTRFIVSELILNILYFSILLHSFNTEYLFFCPSM